jgi:hypothetical protein
MVARQRHPAASTFTEGERQQAGHSPHAKGQSRQSSNAIQARLGLFGARWATGHAIRTILDRKLKL